MVFDAIFSFVFAVVKFILRILNWFGLTIPVFYFLFILLLGLALNDELTKKDWYLPSLIASFALAAIYFFLSKFVFAKKKEFPKFDFQRKNKNQGSQSQNAGDPLTPMGEIISERVFTDPNGNIIQERTYRMPDNLTVRTYPLEQQVVQQPNPQMPGHQNAIASQQNLNIDSGKKKSLPIVEKTKLIDERPQIYRVKNNPGYILKEYSNRVEVYKETQDGYKFIKVDYK